MKKREAKALGLHRYNTGKPCARGHFSDRYTYSGECVSCRAEYNAQPHRLQRQSEIMAAYYRKAKARRAARARIMLAAEQ